MPAPTRESTPYSTPWRATFHRRRCCRSSHCNPAAAVPIQPSPPPPDPPPEAPPGPPPRPLRLPMLSPPLSVTAVRASPRRLSSDGGWLSSEMIGWAHGRCLTADSGCRARLHRRLRRHTQRVTRLWRVLRTCDVSACAARRVSLHFRASSRWAAKRSGWCTVLFDSSTYRKVFQLLSITFSSKYTRHTHASSQNPSFRSESAACVPQPRATRPGMCRPCQRARDPLRAIARRSPAVYPRHRKRRLLRGSGKAEAAARWREATAESRDTQQCAHTEAQR